MITRFELNGNRKELVAAIEKLTGEKSVYMRMPTCAYKIGDIVVEKDGAVAGDISGIMDGLKDQGFVPERAEVKVSVPMVSKRALKNLINLIYVRGELVNRSLGTDFFIAEEVKDGIRGMDEIGEIIRFIEGNCEKNAETGEKAVRGISIDEEKITFETLPKTATDEQVRAFMSLVSMMVKSAKEMFRVNAVKPALENEKYEMRTWLLRLGMIGPAHKEARKALLENLTGHPAYRTRESEEAAKAKRRKR